MKSLFLSLQPRSSTSSIDSGTVASTHAGSAATGSGRRPSSEASSEEQKPADGCAGDDCIVSAAAAQGVCEATVRQRLRPFHVRDA